eukprot:TRINITY_DN16007_c0_g1_i1.p1 TRINITY_DN16007_c0_g1~~TRINITY_DN16007_c0_g1_i1.p1  ORF type:complete len:379 (+),score=79.03 TRINITY_DN16007_c0_g1_i1:201-1337(+)
MVLRASPKGAFRLNVLLAALLSQKHWGASAWSPDGHERIARIAQSLLHGKHRDQVRTMEHGDLIDVSTWERNMTMKHPETDVLHWHHQNPEWTCSGRLGDREGHIKCDGHGAENGSLFCALAYFFEHFAHDMLLKAFPEPKDPINTPEDLRALERVPAEERTSAVYLRWLGILIGDLHQPLHLLRQHEYGRRLKVVYKGEEYTLLAFWEEFIPKHLANLPPQDLIEAQYAENQKVWARKVPMELFREWGHESSEKVCTEVYSKMEVNHADGSRQIDPEFQLSDEMFEDWVAMAQERTLIAGQRLAYVLLEILQHKRHKHAHAEGRGLSAHQMLKEKWRQNFFANLKIAFVVEPLILLVFYGLETRAGFRNRRKKGEVI